MFQKAVELRPTSAAIRSCPRPHSTHPYRPISEAAQAPGEEGSGVGQNNDLPVGNLADAYPYPATPARHKPDMKKPLRLRTQNHGPPTRARRRERAWGFIMRRMRIRQRALEYIKREKRSMERRWS